MIKRAQLPAGVVSTTPFSQLVDEYGDPYDLRDFGPGEPTPAGEEGGTRPRALIPPLNQQATSRPRSWPGLESFRLLKALGNFDLVQVVHADIRGQLLGLEPNVQVRKSSEELSNTDEVQAELAAARAFVECPDPLYPLEWRRWASRVIDEMLTTDALSLYPRFSLGGDPIGLEQIDGSTIVPLVDDLGRPPLPPNDAYQQIVHGRVETGFELPIGEDPSAAELWYLPVTLKSGSPYGQSPLERVLLTVNLGIRKQLHELAFYTDGNVPDSLYALPEGATPDDLRAFVDWLNEQALGDPTKRAGNMLPVPPGQYIVTKPNTWSYEAQEWLGRVIAWAHGVSPLPITRVMNRATSEQLDVQSSEAGLRPMLEMLRQVVNRYLWRVLQLRHVEVRFGAEEREDPQQLFDRTLRGVEGGVLTFNEGRAALGLPEIDEEWARVRMRWVGTQFVVLEGVLEANEVQRLQREAIAARLANPTGAAGSTVALPPGEGDELEAPAEPELEEGDDELEADAGDDDDELDDQVDEDDPDDDDDELERHACGCLTKSTYADELLSDAELELELERFTNHAAEANRRSVAALGKVRRQWLRKRANRAGRCGFVSRHLHPSISDPQAIVKGELQFNAQQQELERLIVDVLLAWWDQQLPNVAAWAAQQTPDVELEAAAGATTLRKVSSDVPLDDDSLFGALDSILNDAFEIGRADGGLALGLDLTFQPEAAVRFAGERAAELVGKTWVNGILVENPNPQFAITPKLRKQVREQLTELIEQRTPPNQIARALQDVFTPARARTIARTETAFAYGHGTAEAFGDLQVAFVEILDGPGCLPTGHDDNAPLPVDEQVGVVQDGRQADGQIWTLEQYRARPIGHPNCVRGAVPWFPEEG